MLRLLCACLFGSILLGYVTGGRLSNLAETRFRLPWVGAAAVVLQFIPIDGRAGDLVLTLSFVLLLVVAGANVRLPGFALILVGLGMNFAVITVNHGMPVTREAIVASGQADTLAELRTLDSPKHHLRTAQDRLVLLADVIAIPPPVRQAVSVGDLASIVGAMWFVIGAMQRSPTSASPRDHTLARGAPTLGRGAAPAPSEGGDPP